MNKTNDLYNSTSENINAYYQSILNSSDSSIELLSKIQHKFTKKVDDKIEKYTKRINTKSKKTLKRLVKWESSIQRMLIKLDPSLAKKLFDPPNITFKELYQKLENNEISNISFSDKYDRYHDKLKAQIGFISKLNQSQGNIMDASKMDQTLKALDSCTNAQAVSLQIKKLMQERKELLIKQSFQLIGKNKYLKRIQKETFYYAEALKNYKSLFKDPDNIEKLAGNLIRRVNGFEQFSSAQSGLQGIFSSNIGLGQGLSPGTTQIANALPTRSSLQQQVALQMPALRTINPQQMVSSSIQNAKAQLDDIQNKARNIWQGAKNEFITFKPNRQKALTFKQRLEYGFDVQFKRSSNSFPTVTDLSYRIGYKLNDVTSAGLGIAIKVGLGKGWDQIKFTGEGLGLRAYYRWKRKSGWFFQGSVEGDYNRTISKISDVTKSLNWNTSGLLGLGKSVTSWKNKSQSVMLMYDIFYFKKTPTAQPFVIRMGYDINK